MLIDSHVHLCDEILLPHLDALLQRAQAASITELVLICTNLQELQRALEVQKKYPQISIAASTTPHEAHLLGDVEFAGFEQAARQGKLIALGETGLEYHHIQETKEIQKELFIRYLKLADELKLPVVIHCRDAFDDFFTLIDGFPSVKGVLHCFTGTLADAKQLVERGWMISFSGIVTFKKSQELQEVVRWVPVEHLLIETDAPYLAPQSRRGQVNEPSYLPEILKTLCTLKNQDLEEQIYQNTKKFFWR
jgi:TatD DNase family protein